MESMNYKDAPPDIKRQMEAAAGFKPSKEDDSEEQGESTPDGRAPARSPSKSKDAKSTSNASAEPPTPVNVIPDPTSQDSEQPTAA